MATERLLRKASQTLRATGSTGVFAAALFVSLPNAHAQYAVSDAQLQSSVTAALHNDTKLSGTAVTATASQGVVTLSGNVDDENARLEAEQVAAGVSGVRSIQDNLTIPGGDATAGSAPAAAQENAPPPPPAADQANTAPAPPDQIQAGAMPPPPPDGSNAGPAQAGAMPPPPPAESGQGQYTPYPNGSGPTSQNGYPNQNYPNQNYPNQNYGGNAGQYGNYPPQGSGYPGGYGPRGNAPAPVFSVTPQQQNASGPVTVPAGTVLSVRTTQPLSTNNLREGDTFQVTAANDVYANGVVAIPRGAVLSGQVVEAKNAGAFGGSPRLDLKLASIQLGPTTYPLVSEVWSSQGPSKTGYTATNTVGGALVGALIGGVAGGGVGAGVGAVAGGASGALISGATHGPRLDLPPEALLQFHIAQPLTVQPVPYDEAARMAASAPQPVLRTRPVYGAAPYPYAVRPYPYYPYGYYYPRY